MKYAGTADGTQDWKRRGGHVRAGAAREILVGMGHADMCAEQAAAF